MNRELKQSERQGRPARRTEPKEVRRSQLIDATINSIAKNGIGGTTMSTVTENAGLSIGIVNFHFKSKQNLFEETLVSLAREHHDQWMSAYRDAGLTSEEKLVAIVDAHFDSKICSRKKLSVWFAFYGEARRRERYRHLIDQIDDERIAISTRLCREIAENGSYASSPSPERVAQTLEALYDGSMLNLLMYPGYTTREQARDHVHAYLATVYPNHIEMPKA
ncbi:MAG: TetR family transcriptional regulator C-terminal domain-containing protein [Pseudomonadota bacterium]